MEDKCVCCGEYVPEGRMVCYSCEKLPYSKVIIGEGEKKMSIEKQMIFKKNKMWRRELLKNKLYSIILIGIGALSVLIEYDCTFFIFTLIIGLPLFFAKENWIM